jgi:riboflavin synthase
MFTGIIEELGIVSRVRHTHQNLAGAVIQIQCSKILEDLKTGDSVAINGTCQTAVEVGKNFFEVETSLETLNLTNLASLKTGQKVNLERAMSANSRFGGHIVSGHIEGTGVFLKKETQGLAKILYFEAPENILKYLIYKGSVCLNGISLTIASLKENVFSVSVVPHTLKETNLYDLKSGDIINLEPDIIAKYVEKFVSKADNMNGKISVNFLEENGFY